MKDRDWWKGILRICDLGVEDWLKVKVEEVIDCKADLKFNVEHLGCEHSQGGIKGIFYYNTKVAEKVEKDILKEYLPLAQKHKIKVLIYFNVHWLHPEFALKHKDWLQIDAEGNIINNLYGLGMSPCVNSAGFRKWSSQVIKDLAKYEIAGIFLDGPIFAPKGCYCQACQEKFLEKFHASLPRKEDWGEPLWKNFILFRYQSIADYMKDAHKILKGIKPSAIIYMNGQGLWPGWPNGRDNRLLAPYQDLIGAEGGFIGGDLSKVSLFKPSMSAKLLETQAQGKPIVIFIAGKNCHWDSYLLTPAETKLLYAGTIAHGANPWYGIFYSRAKEKGALAAKEMNRFIAKNSGYLEDTESVANVALLWSKYSADYYRGTVPVTDFTQEGEKLTSKFRTGDHFLSFRGYFEALTRRQILFDVLDEEALTFKNLKKYEFLILPNCACLSYEKEEIITEYVSKGGNLIATYETGCYDAWGNSKDEISLAKLFGIEYREGILGPYSIDYFQITQKDSIFTEVSSNLLPLPEFTKSCKPLKGRVLAYLLEPMKCRYQSLPPLSKHPAIISNQFEKGSSIYFTGNLAESYLKFHHPDYLKVLTNPVLQSSKLDLILKGAPQTLQVSLRKKDGLLILHLINFTGEMNRPIERIIPLYNIEVTLPQLKDARLIKSLIGKRELPFKLNSSGLSFKIPEIKEYEVVVIAHS